MPSNLIAKFPLAVTAVLMVVSVSAEPVPAGSDDEIQARLAPFGSLCKSGESCGGTEGGGAVADASNSDAGTGKPGAEIYKTFCFACHNTGASEAPVFGDAEAWAPRIEKGMDVLMTSTLNGIGLMPPRGACMACSDDELEGAVEYMLSQVQ